MARRKAKEATTDYYKEMYGHVAEQYEEALKKAKENLEKQATRKNGKGFTKHDITPDDNIEHFEPYDYFSGQGGHGASSYFGPGPSSINDSSPFYMMKGGPPDGIGD